MKTKYLYILLLAILSTAMFSSCDSLWQVQEGKTISINLDMNQIGQFGTARSGDELTDVETIVHVSLHNSKTDKIIDEQVLTIPSLDVISATFKNVAVGTELYAVIQIIGPTSHEFPNPQYPSENVTVYLDTTLFRARSDYHIVAKGENNIVAKPNAVYLHPDTNPHSGVPVGDDNNSGLIADFPVATLSKAMEILTHDGKILPGSTIYLKSSIDDASDVIENNILDGKGVTIKKFVATHFSLFNLFSSVELKNITIDGNADYFKKLGYIFDSELPLITFTGSDGPLKLSSNTVITNGGAGGISLNGGQLSLEGNPIVTGNYDHTKGKTKNIDIGESSVELTVTNLNNPNIGITVSDTVAVGSFITSGNVGLPSDILTYIKPDGDYAFELDGEQIKLIPAKNIAGVYRLGSKEALEWFRDYVNNGNANVDAVLTQDVTLPSGHWVAIGSGGVEYSGSFDGQGYTISELNINDAGLLSGLFGTVSGATIKNVIVNLGIIESAGDKSGVVVGNAKNGTRIINVGSSGNIAIENFGGIVGTLDNSTISSCFSRVNGPPDYTYKVVADKNNTITITDCYYDDSNGAYWKQTNEGEEYLNMKEFGGISLLNNIYDGMNSSNTAENYEWYYDEDVSTTKLRKR